MRRHLGDGTQDPRRRRQDFERRLQTDAGDLLDCRNAEAPLLEIELLEGKAPLGTGEHRSAPGKGTAPGGTVGAAGHRGGAAGDLQRCELQATS